MANGYSNEEVTVFFDNDTCMHSGNCVNSLKSVFNPKGRPWINMQGAPSDEIIKVVKNCPSGALSYKMNSEMSWQKSSQVEEVSIKVNKGGPYAIRGRVKIIDKDGTETIKEGPFILCRCGESKTKPFCDNSHRDIEFDD
jgi:uncharacterized Fe-S cluster protein YjdI